jgi:hypothetical protein
MEEEEEEEPEEEAPPSKVVEETINVELQSQVAVGSCRPAAVLCAALCMYRT